MLFPKKRGQAWPRASLEQLPSRLSLAQALACFVHRRIPVLHRSSGTLYIHFLIRLELAACKLCTCVKATHDRVL